MATRARVTADSTDEEIIAAINAAGDQRLSWRKHDRARPGENNTRSWVKPNDIGYSSHDDPSLLKRLRQMVKAGLLEERAYGAIVVQRRVLRIGKKNYFVKRGPPRFRSLV